MRTLAARWARPSSQPLAVLLSVAALTGCGFLGIGYAEGEDGLVCTTDDRDGVGYDYFDPEPMGDTPEEAVRAEFDLPDAEFLTDGEVVTIVANGRPVAHVTVRELSGGWLVDYYDSCVGALIE